ncbi:hypothetical protein OCK02_15015 [Rhizobium sp. TRM96647]|uniref:hypothetical protein n=1 Tax=unclassified Rhizobium TaxID=2613769 RepID=UPI0021E9A0AE|nr:MULTISPECIES: hypothetical protein [unclassified Rhizobium]MCV3737525.1 hypothetical protein [Rhizobium sp. TRM96647]MCV3756385.1 hypothetical protein [Rhizobium sp. TRM96650]
MKAALIVMTILGCDDSVTQCHYIDTVDSTWQSVALCDTQSEAQMTRYQNANYPVVVAVCESRSDQQNAGVPEAPAPQPGAQADALPSPAVEPAVPAPPEPSQSAAKEGGVTARTIAMLRRNLPDAGAIRNTVTKPFRYAEDGYSWVVRKFAD